MRLAGRSAVALRHVSFEDLGLLAPILDEAGWDIAFCEAVTEDLSHPSIAEADLLIVLGGPIGAYETEAYPFLDDEIRLIEERLSKGRPILGICLGSQLMARALGARVFPGPRKEIGWARIELTDDGRRSCLATLSDPGAAVLHWHGDTFDLPTGAKRLAFNGNYENQAFSYGDFALALQFHLEADQRQLEEWYVGHAVELTASGISVPGLRDSTAAVAGGLRGQAERIFNGWLATLPGLDMHPGSGARKPSRYAS